VDEKIRTIGKNKLTEKKKTPWYFQLLHEFTGFFAYLLWASGILSFIAYGLDTSDPSNVIIIFNYLLISALFRNCANSSSGIFWNSHILLKC
jgi:sodium/potassium-transporting ATPase subunit alpha